MEAMEDHLVEEAMVVDLLVDHLVEAGLSTPSYNPQEVGEVVIVLPSGRDGLLIHLVQDLVMEEAVVDQVEAMEDLVVAMVDQVEVAF